MRVPRGRRWPDEGSATVWVVLASLVLVIIGAAFALVGAATGFYYGAGDRGD